MATGQPRLLVWRLSDNTLRLFEFNPVVGFVQTATTSLPHQGGGFPTLEFVTNEKLVLTAHYNTTSGQTVFNLRELDANFTMISTNSYGGQFNYDFRLVDGYTMLDALSSEEIAFGDTILGHADTKTGSYLEVINDPDDQPATFTFTDAGVVCNCVAIHPQQKFKFVGSKVSQLIPANGRNTNDKYQHTQFTGTADAEAVAAIEAEVIKARWSPDGQYLYTADVIGYVSVFLLVDSKLVLLNKFIPALANVAKIVACADNKRVAIISESGGDFTTEICQRIGQVLKVEQTITNFGRGFDWTIDGLMLVDAITKRCYRWDTGSEAFVERADLITNIPAAATMQLLSTHRVEPVKPSVYAYNDAVKNIADDIALIDVNNIRAYGYKDTMDLFDANTVGSDSEHLVGNGWPSYGKLLTNVSLDFSGDMPKLVADPIKQIFLEDTSLRYVVIKDATNNIGIAVYDFNGNITVEQYKELTLTFTDGVLSFGV